MAIPPERSNPLHNFSLPYLKWGNQKFLRCMKIISKSQATPPNSQIQLAIKNPKSNKVKVSPLRPSKHDSKQVGGIKEKSACDLKVSSGEDESGSSRPWNLRKRRSACIAPLSSDEKKDKKKKKIDYFPNKGEGKREEGERAKLSISLSREEIEEDFVAMTGKRPPRRPKKRSRIVQRQLDSVFPGTWLTEVTLDSYKVQELPESGKGI